jgi:hypothetical protein
VKTIPVTPLAKSEKKKAGQTSMVPEILASKEYVYKEDVVIVVRFVKFKTISEKNVFVGVFDADDLF